MRRLLGTLCVLKEVRCPKEEDSAQWLAWFNGFPRTSKLESQKEKCYQVFTSWWRKFSRQKYEVHKRGEKSSEISASCLKACMGHHQNKLPVHGLGGISFKPEYQINVVVRIFWQNVTGKFGNASQDGLNVSDGHCKSNSSLESSIRSSKTYSCMATRASVPKKGQTRADKYNCSKAKKYQDVPWEGK